ncbi:MAG: aryl-sulfate sulfotransferase [Melioribacteraceae bacterium]|nr:aryl-sulfate sulfotransferase [Melioribacteraceae bacterium]
MQIQFGRLSQKIIWALLLTFLITKTNLSQNESFFDPELNKTLKTENSIRVINGVSVPSYFPNFNPSINSNLASDKKLFLINGRTDNTFLLIYKNDGTPYFYKEMDNIGGDLKLHPNNILTYWLGEDVYGFIGLDSNFNAVDTFRCTTGYNTDFHEITILENGNYFVICDDYRIVDMSELIDGGKSEAIILENVFQEYDKDHNLVLEWKTSDHFDVFDSEGQSLTSSKIDYVHINSIAVDYDSNIIISSRHLSEVTKIDRQTGNIIWRFGGKNNQFLIDDDITFSYQHDVRPVDGKPGHYLMLDNGNLRNPKFSRSVEYIIDSENMTAKKVWEYRAKPDIFTSLMGSTQRLQNGNTLINWANTTDPAATEVEPEGNIVYEAGFDEDYNSYRTHRYKWSGIADKPYLIVEPFADRLTLLFNKFGDKKVDSYNIYTKNDENQFNLLDKSNNPFYNINKIDTPGKYSFAVTAVNFEGNESAKSNIVEIYLSGFDSESNLVKNGDFSEKLNYWNFESDSAKNITNLFDDNGLTINIEKTVSNYLDILLTQENITLINDVNYIFEFDATAEENSLIKIKLGSASVDYAKIGTVLLEKVKKHYGFEFKMNDKTDYETNLYFQLGAASDDITLNNISLKKSQGTAVSETESIMEFNLKQNYPNPFNPATTIEYTLPNVETRHASSLRLELFDILGRKIKTLVNEYQKPGNYKIEFDASYLASGIYIYQLNYEEYSVSKKMLLIK